METAKEMNWMDPRSWSTILASLLPLWLLSIAIMAEGFPRPPVSVQLGFALFVAAIAVSVIALWKGWMGIELFLYSLIPLGLMIIFDEISTNYKSPFILLCAIILTAGVVGYRHTRSAKWHWLILLVFAIVTLAIASHATDNFWHMAGVLGYAECFPDGYGCAPLTGQATSWWVLFFSY